MIGPVPFYSFIFRILWTIWTTYAEYFKRGLGVTALGCEILGVIAFICLFVQLPGFYENTALPLPLTRAELRKKTFNVFVRGLSVKGLVLRKSTCMIWRRRVLNLICRSPSQHFCILDRTRAPASTSSAIGAQFEPSHGLPALRSLERRRSARLARLRESGSSWRARRLFNRSQISFSRRCRKR